MSSRRASVVTLVIALVFLAATPASAGGWATITLDELPAGVVAGQPFEIGFVVLQHGRTPMAGLSPVITARQPGNTNSIRVSAAASGETGHYTAEMTLPSQGEWYWEIDAFITAPMPPLQVSPAAAPVEASLPSTPLMWLGVFLLAASCIALLVSLRRRARWGYALAALTALIALGVFLLSRDMLAGAGRPVQAAAPSDGQMPAGEALFIAKGCTFCHLNGSVDPRYIVFTTEVGPNLTSYRAAPEYLRTWLADPQSVKPETQMPDLDLDEAEIEALIAFLDQGEAE